MRIVGGKYRGRVLTEFGGKDIRPTSDMARESLFNILQFKIQGKTFLDLFCGTGAIGIEALSRGAGKVVFNDADRRSVEVLKKNLEKLKVEEPYAIKNLDALSLLKNSTERYDFIYIDPPYKTNLGLQALSLVDCAIADGGIVIYESETRMDRDIDGFKIIDERKYGRIHLTFFQRG